ncbi:hypothetical protein [Pseudoalteromonas sp. SCSIO 43101]|uniref:hypothetical protein n=1 Tax=Pseudoalteromonas sp. SCSIO 43101 TaxID=2822847 RepID=UPI00202B6668|nr:hypothetical protein [Pseudoalteromonas sp. SCSIO 43101]URQ89901.1 hypothetical protein J8Z25_14220 [Pseudoalteromonas sp. SCSIO 43101]
MADLQRRNAIKCLAALLGVAITPVAATQLFDKTDDSHFEVLKAAAHRDVVTQMQAVILELEPNEQLYFDLVAFTDLMLANTLNAAERTSCLKGAELIAAGDLSLPQLADKLTGLFTISLQQQQHIIAQQALPLSEVSPDKRDEYLIYKCIFTVREFLLLGYFTSEKLQAS